MEGGGERVWTRWWTCLIEAVGANEQFTSRIAKWVVLLDVFVDF
jgi:hypothetical protein